jgi:hypothetical protein
MIIWKYAGVPTEPDLEMSSPTAFYSVMVLVMVKWENLNDPPEPRLAQYVTYKAPSGNLHEHWLIWGMTGNTRVIAWTYITPLKPHKLKP